MTHTELGMFEDDPRSQEGARALDLLNAQQSTIKPAARDNVEIEERWGLEPDSDPRVVATKAAIRDERTFEAYRQREAWVMQPGVEVELAYPTQ